MLKYLSQGVLKVLARFCQSWDWIWPPWALSVRAERMSVWFLWFVFLFKNLLSESAKFTWLLQCMLTLKSNMDERSSAKGHLLSTNYIRISNFLMHLLMNKSHFHLTFHSWTEKEKISQEHRTKMFVKFLRHNTKSILDWVICH